MFIEKCKVLLQKTQIFKPSSLIKTVGKAFSLTSQISREIFKYLNNLKC